MARNVSAGSRVVSTKEKVKVVRHPNDIITIKAHQRAADGLEKITKALSGRAEDCLKITSLRVELGKIHILDVAVDHLAKELGVEL